MKATTDFHYSRIMTKVTLQNVTMVGWTLSRNRLMDEGESEDIIMNRMCDTRNVTVLLLLLLSAAACRGFFGTPAAPAAERMLAVVNGTILDGTGAPPIKDGVVLIRGNRIAAVGPKARVPIPFGASRLDARGGTVLPGLIDAHVHGAFDPAVRRKYAQAGITAVCDLGSPLARMAEFGPARDGGAPIARGFKAGPIFTAPGGLPDAVLMEGLNYEVGTTLQAREGVRDVVKRGADVVKVYLHSSTGGKSYPVLNRDTLKEIVREAHALHRIVRAHVTQIEMLPLALETGVDVIDHIPRPDLSRERVTREIGGSREPMKALQALVNAPEYGILLPRLVRQETALVTTLALVLGEALDSRTSTLPLQTIAQTILDILKRFRDSGGIVALGTDSNLGMADPVALYFKEIDILLAAGLSPLETIAAATRNAAVVSGHGDDLGTLASGRLADILIIGGNPLEDIKALRDIVAVIQDGVVTVSASSSRR